MAFAAVKRAAIGLPTIFERPTTTASRPDKSCPHCCSIIIMAPAGVQGMIASSSAFAASFPILI